MIKESSMPVILAGNGIFREEAATELRKLVQFTGLPVATTFMGKGAIAADDEHYLGSMGIKDHDHIMCGFEMADLIICIGYDYVEYSPKFWNPEKSKKIIHIHTDQPEIDENYIPDVLLIGGIRKALFNLRQQCDFVRELPDRFTKVRSRMKAEIEDYAEDMAYPIKPQKILPMSGNVWTEMTYS
ncbi:MAG: hypothetical protein R2741_10650 [Methanolobus sp.]